MLNFLYTAVSWVLLRWHQLLDAIGMDPHSGLTWALSIVLLVITARVLLFRLFVRQVHYQRNMARLQPEIKKLRDKYKDDRAEMNRKMMELQQKEGFNPLAGCLPMFLQIPVFIGLYHTLRHVADSAAICNRHTPPAADSKAGHLLRLYSFSPQETCSAAKAHLFGAPLAASFRDNAHKIHDLLGGDVSSTRTTLLILLFISAGATLLTQLLVRWNNTAPVTEGTAATVQRLMLWVIPAGVLVSGLLFNFPLGVLLYWFTSNLWTLGQQAYIIRFHPPEAAAEAKPVGELGKTLAPRPGQRPTRNNPARNNKATAEPVDEPVDAVADSPPPRKATDAAHAVPRPGQRPSRPGGKRPPAKRPTQSKKRR